MPVSVQDLFLQFDPLKALEAGDPRYVDCFEVRGAASLYANMALPLATPKATTQFFSGHMGDGKTTILKELQGRFEDDGYFVAYGEADQRLDLATVTSEEVLLALLAVVDEALRRRYREDCEAGLFQQTLEFLTRIAKLPVELKASSSVKLGPFAKITATVKDASS